MRLNTFRRNLQSALAGSSPAFTPPAAKEYEGAGRRMLSALAGSSPAFRSRTQDEYRLEPRTSDTAAPHIIAWGPAGSGKTELMSRLLHQVFAADHAVIITNTARQDDSSDSPRDPFAPSSAAAAIDFGPESTGWASWSVPEGRESSGPARRSSRVAASLNRLAELFGKVGRWDEAVEADLEAVAIYRQLAAAEPNRFRVELLESIGNLSVALEQVGRLDEAISLAEEAVMLSRQLADRQQVQ